jgi:hypothetical protein
MSKLICAVISLTFFALPLSQIRADEQQESLPAQIEKRLQGFDPVAVAAARHYYESPTLKNALKAAVPQIVKALGVAIRQGNPGLDEPTQHEALQAAEESVTSKLDLMTEMNMVAALEVFSKDEIVALDQFYSSPVGQSVMTKLPQVMSRLPAMMQVLMPLMVDDLRAKMKAKGKDLKL